MNFFKKMRLEREAARAPGGIYERMAKYEGSPEYQAMLAEMAVSLQVVGSLAMRFTLGHVVAATG